MARLLIYLCLTGLIAGITSLPVAAQTTNEKRIEKIKEYINEAGELYKQNAYDDAAKRIGDAQKLMARAIEEGKESDRELLEAEYKRISKAHELLADKDVELQELVAFPDELGKKTMSLEEQVAAGQQQGSDAADDTGQTISFENEIVPILVKNCGNCHIRRSQGEFSMASFEVLMKAAQGSAVIAGKSADSLIVEKMESGEMPPRDEMPKSELALIKKWIEAGAKFDGDNPRKRLATGSRRGR